MNKKSIGLFFYLFLLSTTLMFAVDPEKYDWIPERSKYVISAEDQKSTAIVLKDKRVVEYIFDESKNLLIYKTLHKIILVNSSEAIDQYNKVYIQIEDPNSLISIKARSINKNGKVTLLDKSNLKELQNMENYGAFKIFAIEGLEPGSEIEYIYTVKRRLNFFGREFFQSNNPEKDIDFTIVSPENLKFEAKGYNGLPELIDTVINAKRFLSMHVESVPESQDEEYAVYEANLKRVDFKLTYNLDRGKSKLLTFANAAENKYGILCVFTSAELSKVKKLCKSQKFHSISDEESKIRAVETYIKTNYAVKEGNTKDFYVLDKIISNRYGAEDGLIRLYEAIFSELKIEHRMVYTTDRSECKFDGKFETWNYLDKFLFYFPSSSKYLAPTEVFMRYGMIPFYWTHNDGLFIKKVKIGDTETCVSEVKFIPALSAESSLDNIYADIVFSDDLENVNIKASRKIGGYNAMSFQPYYKLIDAEKQSQLNDELMKFISKDAEVSNIKVENIDSEKSLIDFPFIIKGDIKISSLIEKAGNKYFFKVGDVIGRQSELYADKKRVNSVENDFNRIYQREIKIKIPNGYVFQNLNDININVAYEEEGKKTMGFISGYKLEGDMLIININEYYNKIDFPLSMFEEFRKVINAAADFNKIVLILNKVN